MIDVRVYAEGNDGHIPTSKGIAIGPAIFRDVIAALKQAEMKAEALGLLLKE